MPGKRIVSRRGDPRISGSRLTVDLTALADNYRILAAKSGTAKTACVVKANGYGLGAAEIAPALMKAGCRQFFVANAAEGVTLRKAVRDHEIFVLGGIENETSCAIMAEARLVPVLQSREAIALWSDFWSARGSRRPCAIMTDTGMNRLGLTPDEAEAFAAENTRDHVVTVIAVLSHLACADEPEHDKNREQLESFQRISTAFSGIDSSLANSAGIFLGTDYHFDMTRPGISLYGSAPVPGEANPMHTVATFEARILQIRQIRAGETVSYGASQKLARETIAAVTGAGYADGYHRAFSTTGVQLREDGSAGGFGFVKGRRVPVLGRVTMDQTVFDVTDLGADGVKAGDWIELFGPNLPIDEAARMAGTISYELLTGCARRAAKRYIADGDEP